MLYEVTLRGTYFGQQIVNRWNYLSTGVPAAVLGSFGLTSALGFVFTLPDLIPITGTLFRAIINPLSNVMAFNSVSVRAVYDVSDFYELPYPIPITGQTAGEASAPFVAFGFRTNRVRQDIRRATKRFAGVPEAYVQSGGVVTAGALSDLTTIATRMNAVVTYDDEGNTLSYAPCVVHKQRYNPATGLPDPSGSAYRYFPSESEQLANLATGIQWQPYDTARSQTSRQYQRGQ